VNADRQAARNRHPAAGRPLWTSIEQSAPVEAIWMLELADLLTSEPDDQGGVDSDPS
jgi:hypothetical protein